jgi:magnesium-transporting ATPase (P-type)
MKFNGLTDKEVEDSRSKFGSNEIPDSEPTTFWEEFKETFGDPMIKILLAIAVLMIVMFFFGYAEIYEPLGTIVAVLIVAFVSAKTGVASDTKYRELKDSTKKDQCKVHRNGVVAVIDVDDVVVGDKVLLQSGDKIPADGIWCLATCGWIIPPSTGRPRNARKTLLRRMCSWRMILREIPLSTAIPCSAGQWYLTEKASLMSAR